MSQLYDMLRKYLSLVECETSILSAFTLIKETYQNGGKLLICGNGRSSADSEHIVGELMKEFILKRKIPESDSAKIKAASNANGEYICANLQGALPAISLVSQSSIISAYSNDVASDMVFAQQVYGYAKQGDCFIGISTSGSSKNVVYAAETAKAMSMKTIA